MPSRRWVSKLVARQHVRAGETGASGSGEIQKPRISVGRSDCTVVDVRLTDCAWFEWVANPVWAHML